MSESSKIHWGTMGNWADEVESDGCECQSKAENGDYQSKVSWRDKRSPVKYDVRKYAKEPKRNGNKMFRLCYSVINNVECTNIVDNQKCKFAHSIEEFTPKICRYDADCKNIHNDECSKLHPSIETKLALLERIGLAPKKWNIEEEKLN